MAVFNPDVKDTQDPNYLNYSKVVNPPSPDKSTAMAINTAGDALEMGVKLSDTYVKKDIDNQIYAQVDRQRDAYTDALQSVNDQLKGNPTASPSEATGNALIANQTPPAALQSSLDRVDNLGAARAANKINDTYYTQQLNSIAKDIRNQYPGYREYIDSRIQSVTGLNPANAYYQNLMQDINSTLQKNKSAGEKIDSELYKNIDIPGMDKIILGRKAGIVSDEQALGFLNRTLSKKYMYNDRQMDRTERNQNREDVTRDTKTDFTNEVGTTLQTRFSTLAPVGGLTAAKMADIVQQAQEGRVPLTSEQHDNLLTALVAAKNGAMADIKKMSNDRGYTGLLGVKDRDDIVASQMYLYDQAIDAVKNKDYGTAFTSLRRGEALQNDEQLRLLKDPSVGAYTRAIAALTKFGGPNWVSTTMATGLLNDVDVKYKNYVQDAITRSQLPDSYFPGQPPKSLYSDIKDAQSKKIGANTKVFDHLVDNVNTIRNPKAPDNVKSEVARYMFNPNNYHVMDQFKMDYTDPQTGKVVKGKYSVFNRLTSPDITDSMIKLGKQDPQAWGMYKDWVETSFGTLFREDIQNLNSIQNDPMLLAKVKYNSDTHQFFLTNDKNQPVGLSNTLVGKTINRLNMGLSNVSRMKNADNSDADAYVLNLLQKAGYRPGEKVEGLPQRMIDAVINSKKSFNKRFEDTFGPQ